MWIETPDDPFDALINLQNYEFIGVEQLDEEEFALIAYVNYNQNGAFTVIKKARCPTPLNSILLGLGSCQCNKRFPLTATTTPTLH